MNYYEFKSIWLSNCNSQCSTDFEFFNFKYKFKDLVRVERKNSVINQFSTIFKMGFIMPV